MNLNPLMNIICSFNFIIMSAVWVTQATFFKSLGYEALHIVIFVGLSIMNDEEEILKESWKFLEYMNSIESSSLSNEQIQNHFDFQQLYYYRKIVE